MMGCDVRGCKNPASERVISGQTIDAFTGSAISSGGWSFRRDMCDEHFDRIREIMSEFLRGKLGK
ncbi:MAG: hypothetical protein D6773_03525 [Alphaproteobacteria bacterium]|nr:MAG: hypothetical protein D6773_03525 [Alphaproteobacteria bacterium]